MAPANTAHTRARGIAGATAIFFGVVLALATTIALALLGWVEYQAIVRADRERGEMHVRVLDDQATRSIDNVQVALKYLAREIEVKNVSMGPAAANQVLAQAVNALPNVRSLSMVAPDGRVLSSSANADLGLQIEIGRLGKLPRVGQEQLAGFVPGRSLKALTGPPAESGPGSGIGFIPLILALNTEKEGDLYLVALINPDSFSNYQLLTVNNPRHSAYLLSYEGSILASSGTGSRPPGETLAGHAVLKTYLPAVEHGSYVGTGTSPDKQVVAFRLSKTRPLVVVLEQPFADSLSHWLAAMRWFALAAALTLVFIAFMTAALVRSLGARERALAELEAARQALQHQLAFVALLLEISPTPVSTTDVHGRYLSVNKAWEEFTGYSRHQVMGKDAAAFMPDDDAHHHQARDADAWHASETVRYEARIRHASGLQHDVVMTKLLVPGDDRFAARLLGTMMDVSEFREAERATREARDAAEESSRAKSEFIANISHELRTPLQSILGFSELGLMRGSQYPKLHAMFTDIHASGTRMLSLVNDLLDVSKIESAVGAVTLERADLRGLIEGVLRELKPQLDARQVRTDFDPGDQPLMTRVDPARFAQVIRNVTANAIKFSPPGEVIEVRAAQTADGRLDICVRDHGMGIPAGETEQIFEAFVQSSRTKDGSGGTGLGLAICRKILEVHGGSISAGNMPDGGAAFNISLPGAPRAQVQSEVEGEEPVSAM